MDPAQRAKRHELQATSIRDHVGEEIFTSAPLRV